MKFEILLEWNTTFFLQKVLRFAKFKQFWEGPKSRTPRTFWRKIFGVSYKYIYIYIYIIYIHIYIKWSSCACVQVHELQSHCGDNLGGVIVFMIAYIYIYVYIYIYLYICIYLVEKRPMHPPGYYQSANGVMVTNVLRKMMYMMCFTLIVLL